MLRCTLAGKCLSSQGPVVINDTSQGALWLCFSEPGGNCPLCQRGNKIWGQQAAAAVLGAVPASLVGGQAAFGQPAWYPYGAKSHSRCNVI